MNRKVLIVDDEPTVREVLEDAFALERYNVFCAASAEDALQILEKEEVDVVISDELMPGMHGSEFLSIVRKEHPNTIRMILTGHASLEAAIRAINEGEIYRFFTKPCNAVDLAITVRQALQHKELLEESQRLLKTTKKQTSFIENIEKEHPGITQVQRNAEGAVILEENTEDLEWDSLLQEIDTTVKKCEEFFQEDM